MNGICTTEDNNKKTAEDYFNDRLNEIVQTEFNFYLIFFSPGHTDKNKLCLCFALLKRDG